MYANLGLFRVTEDIATNISAKVSWETPLYTLVSIDEDEHISNVADAIFERVKKTLSTFTRSEKCTSHVSWDGVAIGWLQHYSDFFKKHMQYTENKSLDSSGAQPWKADSIRWPFTATDASLWETEQELYLVAACSYATGPDPKERNTRGVACFKVSVIRPPVSITVPESASQAVGK